VANRSLDRSLSTWYLDSGP